MVNAPQIGVRGWSAVDAACVGLLTFVFMTLASALLGPWATGSILHMALCSGTSGLLAGLIARPLALGIIRLRRR